MTTTSSFGITLEQYKAYLNDVNASLVGAISTYMDQLQQSAGNLALQMEATADFMARKAEIEIAKAGEYAQAAYALDPQFPHAAEVFNNMKAAAEQARSMYDGMSKSAYVEAMFNEALQSRAANALGFAGDALDFAKYVDAVQSGEYDAALKQVISWTLTTEVGLLTGAGLVALGVAAIPAAIIAALGMWAFSDLVDGWLNELSPGIYDAFSSAFNFVQRRDPLILDLDGDGIETSGASSTNPILFDHDGDGIKNGTGWVNSDDGLLVLDRNSNGTIDNGGELFGDSTTLSGGGLASDGFAALADMDSNADGVVNASDTNFANLRVWRDLNQDGISQSGELFTLASLGIASINVAHTDVSQNLSNGNTITAVGSFTRTDGSTATVGGTNLGDANLVEDTFHREFTDTIPLAAELVWRVAA